MGVGGFQNLGRKSYVVGLICPPLIDKGLAYSVKITSGRVHMYSRLYGAPEYLLLYDTKLFRATIFIYMIPLKF